MCKGRKGGGDSAQGLSLFLERGEIEERRDGRVAGRTVPERKKRLIIYIYDTVQVHRENCSSNSSPLVQVQVSKSPQASRQK